MRITKVYTRKGDKGTTALADGTRVSKDDPRLEAYGTVDELSSLLGVMCALPPTPGAGEAHARLVEHLLAIQNLLFVLGGDLATPIDARFEGMPVATAEHVAYLERLIDGLNAELPPLADFILPGGPPLAAQMHLARCVCRRAERHTQALAATAQVGASVIPFLNRLSDALFVMARWIAKEAGAPEPQWDRACEPPQWPPPVSKGKG